MTPPKIPRRPRIATWLNWSRARAILLASYLALAAQPLLPDWSHPIVPLALLAGMLVWGAQMLDVLRTPRPAPRANTGTRMDRAADWTHRHARPLMWWLFGYAMAMALSDRLDNVWLANFLRVSGLIQAGIVAVLIAHRFAERDDA